MRNDERFSLLVERCLDREGSAEEMAELQTALRDEPEARERFWDAVEWQALFRQWGEQEWGRKAAEAERRVVAMPPPIRSVRPPVRRVQVPVADRKIVRFPVARWAAGISAAAAVVALVFALRMQAPVASVVKVADAVWSSEKMEVGARLKPGHVRLEKGAIVIAFDRGARVVLEGPVDFEVRDDNSSALFAGRLRAQVPPSAHGFKVETPQFTAVDLGTEFGCDLGVNGTGELHVFTGKVDLQTGDVGSAPVELSKDQAMRIDHGVTTPVAAESFAFLSETELSRREQWERSDFSNAWQKTSRPLNENPATLVHFDFENAARAVVPNQALQAPADSNATVFGCNPAEGRWPGKSALAFHGEDDRLAFMLPGQFQSLTLLAWVRVDSLHPGVNPLVMGRASGAGEVSWYIHRDGGLGLAVRKANASDAGGNYLHTRPVIGQQNFGSWVFVACVFDGVTGAAIQYLNGVKVGAYYGFVRVPFQLAEAEVGNDPSHKPGDPSSNLDGSIDELAVLSTALTPDDIALLYQQGKPAPR